MNTTLTYYPGKGVLYNEVNLYWGMNRITVRDLLHNKHTPRDSIIDLSQYNNGSPDANIIQRRDIYQNYNGENNYFFFNYDAGDNLKEIEIHNGVEIFIQNIKLNFDIDFQDAVRLLKSISKDNLQISTGEYFFKDLKLTIADGETMGGEDNVLSYFYCAKSIDHLIDE